LVRCGHGEPDTTRSTLEIECSDADGIKECLSKDDAQSEWYHGSRRSKWTECLKISVEPEGGSWDPFGENYCYYDRSGKEVAFQVLNVGVWMAAEWGVTAVAAAASGGTAAVGAKAATGFICGAGSEYTAQWIKKAYKQVWPGHPVS